MTMAIAASAKYIKNILQLKFLGRSEGTLQQKPTKDGNMSQTHYDNFLRRILCVIEKVLFCSLHQSNHSQLSKAQVAT